MVGDTKKPPTLIQRPFANAVSARATTKLGNRDERSTTRDSAAKRSRKSHITHVKKALAPGRKFESQYVVIENSREIKTFQISQRSKVQIEFRDGRTNTKRGDQ